MKVLFLDFDGVLNTEKYQTQLRRNGKAGWDNYGSVFDPAAVANLGRIINSVPGLKIVVESSWKAQGLVFLQQMWIDRGLPGEIYDVTLDTLDDDLLTADLSDPEVFSKLEGMGKGREIQAWLNGHPRVNEYVILDDVPQFFEELAAHHIQVDSIVGITSENTEKAIEILGALNDH